MRHRRRRHTPEQIIRKVREADRLLGEGVEAPEVAKQLEVSEQTLHRWRAQYGGLKADDAKRLKELERENGKLKRMVAELAQVALVSEISEISASQLTRFSAALQKQALRDFGPIWDVQATVDAFVRLEDVPVGYWPIIVEHDIGFPGAAGVHLDKDGQPFALVQYSDSWSLTASHECLEMLGDPGGNRLVAGDSIKDDQGRVEYLVEVCDPSEAQEFAYTANGILVSDFYTPRFFDPVPATGVRYSFTGAIAAPRTVLKGGYLSWHDPVSDHWWQQTWFGGNEPVFRDLGVFERGKQSLREMVDAATEVAELTEGLPPSDPRLVAARAAGAASAESTSSKAEAWRTQIAGIKASRPQ